MKSGKKLAIKHPQHFRQPDCHSLTLSLSRNQDGQSRR